MKFNDWLAAVPIKKTPKGVRLNLRLYVYPDTHGNFYVADEDGVLFEDDQPVNNTTEAIDVFHKLWDRATEVAAMEREPA